MTTVRISCLFALVCSMSTAPPALATDVAAPGGDDAQAMRAELESFFERSAEFSPTALAGLAGDARTLEAIRQRIAELSPAELSEMHEAFAAVPAWQMAPEALAAGLPAEARSALHEVGATARARVAALERKRGEIAEVYAVLQMMPDAELERLGVERETLQRGFADLAAVPAPALLLAGDRLGSAAGALDGVAPALRESARLLAEHGPLDQADIGEVRAFRREIFDLVREARALPPELCGGTDLEALERAAERLDQATPEMLFAIRARLDGPALESAMADVRTLTGLGSLSAEERTALSGFGADVGRIFETSGFPAAAARIAQYDTGGLALLRSRVEALPSWRATLPLLLRTAASPAIAERRAALARGEADFDAAELAALESFRAELASYYDALAGDPAIGADRALAAAERVRQRSPVEMYVLREIYAALPPDVHAGLVVDVEEATGLASPLGLIEPLDINCVLSLGSIDLPLGIGEVSLGSINFNFLCDPIETVVNALVTAINAVAGVIDEVFSAVVNLPNTIKDFFVGLAQDLLSLFTPENLANALGLVEGFWENLPEVPQIPCPPDGTTIPFFGEVGEEETASKYSRYLWIFDKVLGIIPETEISLAIKIPAQILYGGVEYLGICLDAAAEQRASAETDAFRAATAGGIGGLEQDVASLAAQVGAANEALALQIAALDGNVLRQQIEQACLAGRRLAYYYLPQAYGGRLELVRDIVAETIDAVIATGEDANGAPAVLADGDYRADIGKYKSAYGRFCKAYCLAVSESSTACP